MMKHYKEESCGLGIEKTLKIGLLFLILLRSYSFAQIPVNGFCEFKSISIKNGFEKLCAIDINNDSYTDLICFSPDKNALLIIPAKNEHEFLKPRLVYFPFSISSIKPISRTNSGNLRCLFVSRESERMGTLLLHKSFYASLISSRSYEGIPGSIASTIEIDNEVPSFLLYGVTFNGLAYLEMQNNKEVMHPICERIPFNNAAFIEFNNDFLPDICAFNILSNEFYLYSNQGKKRFDLVRTLPLHTPIKDMFVMDMSGDGAEDVIFSTKEGIHIYNFSPSFTFDKQFIQTLHNPDMFVLYDFNRDSLPDIAYLNKKESEIRVRYSYADGTYSEESLLLKKPEMSFIKPYSSNKTVGLAAITVTGELYTITSFEQKNESALITVPGYATTLFVYDYANDNIADFGYIDSLNKTLTFVINSKQRVPEKYFTVPLSYKYSSIRIDEIHPYVKMCYCYSENDNLMKAILVNMHDFTFWKNFFYVDGFIRDVRVKEKGELPNSNVEVLSTRDSILYNTHFSFNEFNYDENQNKTIIRDIADVTFGFFDDVFLWTVNNDSIKLDLFNLSSFKISQNIYSAETEIQPITSFSLFNRFKHRDLFLTFLSNQKFLTYYNNLISLHNVQNGFFSVNDVHYFRSTTFTSFALWDENTKSVISFQPTNRRLDRKEYTKDFTNISALTFFPRKLGQTGMIVSFNNESIILLDYSK